MRTLSSLLLAGLLCGAAQATDERIDWNAINAIRDEAFARSRVMDTLGHLTDVIGPRLTGSPQMKAANDWTAKQLEEWGLTNAHLEAWGPFGRGWSFDHTAVHLILDGVKSPVLALPKAWTPGTAGPVRGPVVRVTLDSPEDLEKQRGQLGGKVLLLGDPAEVVPGEVPPFERYTADELATLEQFEVPSQRGFGRRGGGGRRGGPSGGPSGGFLDRQQLNEFLVAEGVLATISVTDLPDGVLRVQGGGSRETNESAGVPALVMAAEHYNRIRRCLDLKRSVELEVDVRATFHDDDLMAYNTVAEVKGTDLADELVLIGGHLDSWHAGTGATDNAAGCAVAMEAARILLAARLQPRRTIRVVLWSGEEEGLLGSRAYVKEHFAFRPDPPQTEGADTGDRSPFGRTSREPLQYLPEWARVSCYFNLDNGSGKIRGIYTQQNAAVAPIFAAWLQPFADLGATTVTNRNTGGTDHQSFDSVGLPGFQFIQDPLDYDTKTHHTNIDVYDRLQREDMMQASAVMASFAWHAATRDELLPRKPAPREEARQ